MADTIPQPSEEDAPEHLPFFRLLLADTRQMATQCARHQNIAADSAFCVAMLGDFEQGLAVGSWGCRQLMMEAGLIGQTLYLGAEAHKMQGTGIGQHTDLDGVSLSAAL
ncbi:nitroreductase family protein [Thiorhodovibrio frisius]|uniref:hypothetical protein n=1 Tax=Thiorhodovibrio frisius TaxID=631362 RepID=UPI000313087F|nr:hypothetical protein [Thiorhodovibrio frisius]